MSIQIELTSTKESYRSRVEAIEKDGFWIATPIKKSMIVPISIGQDLTLSFGVDTCIYKFPSSVIKRVAEPVPMLFVKYPLEKEIQRIQRRYYVRVNAVTPIEYGILDPTDKDNKNVELLPGNTIDLSGGGLQFITKHNVPENKLLQINLNLNNEKLIVFAKPARIRPYPDEKDRQYWAVGVQFINISESERDKIIKYVFDWQREMRKKGLL